MTVRGIRAFELAFATAVVASSLLLSDQRKSATADGLPYVQRMPGIASDSVDPGYAYDCAGDIGDYFAQPQALRRIDSFPVDTGATRVVVTIFEFTNPCPEPIAAPLVHAQLHSGQFSREATMGAFPSLIDAGERAFLTALWYTASLNELPTVDVSVDESQDWSWLELQEVAQLLTVDANGNDATSPDFDITKVVQPGSEMTVTADPQGNPPAWPPHLWLHGTCDDGSLGVGRFFPDEYGYNPVGRTSFEGHTSWLNCQPGQPSISGPWIDEGWMEGVIGAPPNAIVLDDLTLEQTGDASFRLMANVINTNSVAGRPATYSFSLVRASGPPFAFSVPGSETWFPGIQGSIVINNIPGDVDDFSSALGQVLGTVAAPNHPVPGWALPPTYVWTDGTADGPYANLVVVPNSEAIKAAIGPTANFTYRQWLNDRNGVNFLATSGPFAVPTIPDAYAENLPLDEATDLYERVEELEAATRKRLARLATTMSASSQ